MVCRCLEELHDVLACGDDLVGGQNEVEHLRGILLGPQLESVRVANLEIQPLRLNLLQLYTCQLVIRLFY